MGTSSGAKKGSEGGGNKPKLLFGFDRDLCLRVAKLVHELGGTDDQLAKIFNVDSKTFGHSQFNDLDLLQACWDGNSVRINKEEDQNKGTDRNLWLGVAKLVCEHGGGDVELGKIFGVHTGVIRRWKAESPEFKASCQAGESAARVCVERALYQLATGYTETKEEIRTSRGGPVVVKRKVRHPPDPQACRFWLLNSQKKRDQHERAAMKDPDRPFAEHVMEKLRNTVGSPAARKP